ncbi:MAG: hypothetical protein Q8T08_24310 [Ignavibacteria bacterium]|jgi:hypothetical protein|nr:hypothetical protein [Ignavibacteria bacterium]
MKDGVNIKTLAGGLGNAWFLNGRLHREDGPALENNGIKRWYLYGIYYSENEFNSIQLEKQLQAELSYKNNNNKKVKI